jgi:hypothetical protein
MADIEVTLGSPLHLAYLEQAATQRTYRSVIDRLGPAPWSVLGFQGWMEMVSRFTTTMKQPQGKGSGGGGVIGLDRAVYSTASIPELFVELINETFFCAGCGGLRWLVHHHSPPKGRNVCPRWHA